MTYIGGSVVFQFDPIDSAEGAFFIGGSVQVGPLVYFIYRSGFCRTDGVTIQHIGDGKVDRHFWNRVESIGNAQYRVFAAYDHVRRLVYWLYPSSGAGTTPDSMLIYHTEANRWARASFSGYLPLTAPGGIINSRSVLKGFNSTPKLVTFDGAPGTATIITGEAELNPGGHAFVQGVKPLVDVTANAVTAALGSRNDQSSSVSYTSEITANSRSGFCNFRSDARYHRARLTIAGTFNAAQGLEYEAVPSGYT
jgi:hypothetical protein